jgi:catechol 2,3-dioxygenase-like lactoylglutathione lyase family enzyme
MILRVARHTANLEKAISFYVNILGLEILGEFKDHNGYDGVFIGKQDLEWHLEFTTSKENPNHLFDEDDILVFYPRTQEELDCVLNKIRENNFEIRESKNPYWNENGTQIKDFDNHNVIISPLKIKNTANNNV